VSDNNKTNLTRRLELNGSPAKREFKPRVGIALQLSKDIIPYFVRVREVMLVHSKWNSYTGLYCHGGRYSNIGSQSSLGSVIGEGAAVDIVDDDINFLNASRDRCQTNAHFVTV
jgi:hypothetical protein